jgi:LacI family transcriptional regulator
MFERLRVPFNWRGDGVIARITSEQLVADLQKIGVPAVNVSQVVVPGSPFPQVTTDEAEVGRLAAEHFLERGHTDFAYYAAPHREHYRDRVVESFRARLPASLRAFPVFEQDRYIATPLSSHDSSKRLRAMIRSLPRPTGFLCWSTAGGHAVTEACRQLGVSVPDDIAVMSADLDRLMAKISLPPLTCIDHHARQVGYRAAQALQAIMEGQPWRAQASLIKPAGVLPERSTDALVTSDDKLNAAINFVRQNFQRPIQVGDILRAVDVSRRALEVRFRVRLGRSPAAEIRRIRVEHAKRLLESSDLPISDVATEAGFHCPEVMQRAFRRELDLTPTEYRRHRDENSPGRFYAEDAQPAASRSS